MKFSCPECGSNLVDHPEEKYKNNGWLHCMNCELSQKKWSGGTKGEVSRVKKGEAMPIVKVRTKQAS